MSGTEPGSLTATALVTGGAGFFGRHVTGQMLADGWSVRVFDRMPEPRWVGQMGAAYEQGDVCDGAAMGRAMAGIDIVVHAAFAPPERPAGEIQRVNVEGTRGVLKAAADQGVNRFILLSSTIVDRPLPRHFLAGSPLARLHSYRESRLTAESIVSHAADGGLGVAIVRPKTFLGPGGIGAFALLFDLIRRGRPVPVLGRGANRYQLVDIRDLAAGLSLLAGSSATGVFFFGTDRFDTVAQDLGALIERAGTGSRLRRLPAYPGRVGLRAMELVGLSPLSEWHQLSSRGQDSVVDIGRAVVELGWHPARSNSEALFDAYQWFVDSTRAGAGGESPHPPPVAHRALRSAVVRLSGRGRSFRRSRETAPRGS